MRIGFYSCMSGVAWGGSEELWWRAARELQTAGHEVVVNYKWWPEPARQLRELIEHGGRIYYRNQPPTYWQNKFSFARNLFGHRNGTPQSWLDEYRPDAVLITIGYHPDRIEVADYCLQNNIPYAINVQCASNFFFISGQVLDAYRGWYQNAKRVFFVSPENQHKIETNLAASLAHNAEIVCNPFNIDVDNIPGYPEVEDGMFRLACVGRIHFQSKGQDLIIDVLRQPKWRERNLLVTMYGGDQGNRRQLEDLIKMHGLESKIQIAGFVDGVNRIWAENHGLLLPSRYEGAPLCVIEAMMCNRICITTDTGRNRELMDDSVSGFIAAGAMVDLLDDAMERAWNMRHEWKQMGELAGQHVRQRYSTRPVTDFAEKLKRLV